MRSRPASWLLVAATLGVCFAQTGDPGLAGAAKIVTLTGRVSVLKDAQPWALSEGDLVFPKQVIVTGPDGYALFKLADGSTFEVFPNSKATFRNNSDWRDVLDMWLGRVKVHIQKWGGQPNHNRVRTPTAVISVRGTVFDVQVEEDDATTLVVVEEGQVAVQHTLLPRGEPRLLNPGEWLRVYKNEPLAQSSIDRESVLRTALRAMADAIYNTIYRSPKAGSPAPVPGGGGAPLPGDHGSKQPAPPPPPPADAPAPPSGGGASGPPPPPPGA